MKTTKDSEYSAICLTESQFGQTGWVENYGSSQYFTFYFDGGGTPRIVDSTQFHHQSIHGDFSPGINPRYAKSKP